MNKKHTKESGITMVALVITIILLLILASISISALTGKEGIIWKTNEAARQAKIANLQEQIETYIQGAKLKKEEINPEEVFEKMKENKCIDETAQLEGIWISDFDTKVSTLDPYAEAVMVEGSKDGGDGYTYWEIEGENAVIINGYKGSIEKELIVPDYIDGKLVKKIMDAVFYDNKVIETIILPDSLTVISSYTFYGCTSVKEIHLSYLLEEIGEGTFGKNADARGATIKEISIPSRVKKIGENAFVNCNIEKLELNNGLQTIGPWALAGMKEVKGNLKIPSTVTEIGKESFVNYTVNNGGVIYMSNSEITIGENAFYGCTVKYHN